MKEKPIPKISIFAYTDYRKYFADYYNEQKKLNPVFSYQYFSDKAGFRNKGFIFNVIKGTKNLSRSSIVKICRAINLNKVEADYLDSLVSFNQAVNYNEKNFYYEKLNSIKAGNGADSEALKMRAEHYEFYSKLHHSAIRSLIDMHAFKDDYKKLANMVYPPITPKQARKSVELLAKLGLIIKQANGVYKISDKSITTGREVLSLGVLNFHLESMELAAKALKDLPAERRDISGLTLGISAKGYEKIRDEIYNFQGKVMKIANDDNPADRVYQLNFHFVPLSNIETGSLN